MLIMVVRCTVYKPCTSMSVSLTGIIDDIMNNFQASATKKRKSPHPSKTGMHLPESAIYSGMHLPESAIYLPVDRCGNRMHAY